MTPDPPQTEAPTLAEAIAELNAMTGHDAEVEHGRADDLLLRHVDPYLREAYLRAQQRVGFWYA